MRKRAIITCAIQRTLALMCFILAMGQPMMGETTMTADKAIQDIGTVQIDAATVGLQIASGDDFALLELSVATAGTEKRYVPIYASTYRGIPSVSLDVFVSRDKHQIWVQSSWQDSPVLAYHRIGTATAITSFGEVGLLSTPFPEVLSGGPVPFPAFDPNTSVRLATFYIPEAD